MNADKFQVKPVKEYQGAYYPSAYKPAEEKTPKPRPIVIVASILVITWLMFGILCCVEFKTEACDEGLVIDPRGNCVPPDDDDDECVPGTIYCVDNDNFMSCNDTGDGWESTTCETYCLETMSESDFPSWRGCDAASDDPCQCDIVDGGLPFCSPGEMECLDEYTLSTCDENISWVVTDCNQYCQETAEEPGMGWSMGCDVNAEDPCQCEYDIIMGEMFMCTPGDIWCQDQETVAICNDDSFSWSEVGCYDYCVENFGEDYYPTGCDIANEADNICGCEYGIVDGKPGGN
jgi:hypothetical protein